MKEAENQVDFFALSAFYEIKKIPALVVSTTTIKWGVKNKDSEIAHHEIKIKKVEGEELLEYIKEWGRSKND